MVDAVPLSIDADGVYRVGDSRVTLDAVISAFNRGATPEEISQDYPPLLLAEIYQVLGYYLKHQAELSVYFEKRSRDQQGILDAHSEEWSPRGFRDRLQARRIRS